MNEKVEQFLAKRLVEEKKIDDKYYYLVMEYAGLLKDEPEFVEVTKEEYKRDRYLYKSSQREKGKYYIQKCMPIDLSDEEFKAVVDVIPEEKLKEFERQASEEPTKVNNEYPGSSGAQTFLIVLGVFILIFGFIVGIIGGNIEVSAYRKEFDFITFMSIFVTYFIGACFCFCAAELFGKLQTIVFLLRKK